MDFLCADGEMRRESLLPQQAQTIESISGHTYIRKRISLTFFVKKLILWSERLSQGFLGDPTCFVCNVVNGVLTATLVITVLKIKIRQNADLVVNN